MICLYEFMMIKYPGVDSQKKYPVVLNNFPTINLCLMEIT